MPMFHVRFSRIGNIGKGHVMPFRASSIEALEPQINEFVTEVLRKEKDQITVTIDPDNKVGQLDYGLLGNFTITVPE